MARSIRTVVTGELRNAIERKLMEVHAQVINPKGYIHNPAVMNWLLQELVEGRFHHPVLQDVYSCPINYGEPFFTLLRSSSFDLSDEVKAVKAYHISDSFEGQGIKEVRFRLFNDQTEQHFEVVPSGDGCRHATFRELLQFSLRYPEVLKLFSLKALGTTVEVDGLCGYERRVPEVRENAHGIRVWLEVTSFMFNRSDFFLVVER